MFARLLIVLFLLRAAVPALAQDDGPYLFDLMKQPRYAMAWKGMLVGETAPPWVNSFTKSLDGTSAPSTTVSVGGEPYLLGWVCKPHDCSGNELHALFAPGARQAWGLLITGDKRSWLGRPDPAIQAAILSGVK
jgi:Inhibitor of vertebrate lysozyme (Ivy)